ncbi:MAG: AsmA family protein [Desulfarculus sp.]|nr:AsmA family protein [Desulfarculus sp.]
MRLWPWLLASLALLPAALILFAYYLVITHDYNELKPRLAQAVKEATGRELVLAGPLGLRVSFHPRLVLEDISLANPAWASRPHMASLRRAEIEVELWPLLRRRQLVVERLTLEGVELWVESNASGNTNLDDLLPGPAATPRTGQQALETTASQEAGGLSWLSFRRVEIKEARLEWRRPGHDPWLAHLKSVHLEQPQEAGPIGMAAMGSLGDKSFDLSGQAQEPAQPGRPWAIKASWRQPGLELDLEGQVNDLLAGKGLDLGLDAKVADLAALAPKVLSGPGRLRGRLSDPRPAVYRMEGLQLDSPLGALAGWAEVEMDADRPRLSGQVASPALDLAPLWGPSQPAPQASSAGAPGGGRRPGKVFSDDPLPLAVLKALDLDLKLEASAVRMPRLDLAEVAMTMRLGQGGLSLEPFKARLAGGPAHLRLTLTPQGAGQQALLWLKLNQCQIGQVLRRAGAEEVISGEMEALVECKGQGDSLAAIMASLEGKAMAAVRRGRLHKKFLGLWGADLTGGLLNALGDLASGDEGSLLHCLVLGLVAKNGQASTTALALDSQRLVLLGRGRLNLKTEEMELAARPLPKEGLAAPGGLGVGLGNLARPFKLSGPLAQPRLTLDEREVLVTLGKALGGLAALGPLGLAAALTSSGPSDSQLCQEAWAAASQGMPYEPKTGITQPLERLGEDLGGAVRRFLGR